MGTCAPCRVRIGQYDFVDPKLYFYILITPVPCVRNTAKSKRQLRKPPDSILDMAKMGLGADIDIISKDV
jgi:hypothetical protein